MSEFVTLEEIRAAKERIAGVAVRTPLYRVERARLKMGGFPEPEFDLYIKAESEQPIGSFKLRGAYNMVSQLSPEALGRGVITYSSGNHAQGVAYAARALGAKAEGRGVGGEVWLRDDSSVRCAADYCGTGNVRTGNCGAVAGRRVGDFAGKRRRAAERNCNGGEAGGAGWS